ncbi:MAG: sugar phosphate isomerase/epimerase [Armatimonadetes bacterium]|nr:sugar phosphate isomerase/epimerase [Armatimonadota bacterium]
MAKYERKLGVSTSLLMNKLGADWPETSLEALAATPIRTIEYLCVENRFRDDRHIGRVKEAAEACGVWVRSVHAPFGETDISAEDEGARRESMDSVVRAMDVSEALGAKILVLHGSREPIGDDERQKRLKQCVRSLNELCKRASQRGLTLALEALPRTCLGNTVEEVLWLTGIVDGDLKVCYDVNHVTLRADVRDSLGALGDRIATVHISDHDGVDERHWIPGRGVTDWAGFVEGLDSIGYEGCLLHEAMDADLGLAENLEAIVSAARAHLGWDGGSAPERQL